MGNATFSLTNARCVNDPIIIPGATDPSKNHTMITVIANRGKTKGGKQLTTVLPLSFWGPYAAVAAVHLKKGRQINVTGDLVSFLMDTGVVANGKPQRFLRVEGRVAEFEFAGETMKELVARIEKNIAALKAAGRIPAAVNVTGQELLAVERAKTQKFDLSLASQTGMFGNARVFVKGSGWLKPNAAAVIPAPATPKMVDVEQIQAALKAQGIDLNLGVAASAMPFSGAVAS
jgi:hypothetical protein